MMLVGIKENSWLAKIAARKLKATRLAMVVGRTIHLYNTTKQEFLQDQRWVNHEIAHVKQYSELGIFRFLLLYLLESYRKGYYNNRFEAEARMLENDCSIANDVTIRND